MKTLLLAATLVLAIQTPVARACTCQGESTVAEAFRESGAVFEAVVLSQRPAQFEVLVDMRVERSWKGVTARRVVVQTFADEGQCGFPFVDEQRYLVYATNTARPGSPERWTTSICNRTRRIGEAEEDLVFLGERTVVDTDEATWSTLKARFDQP